ncbi:MAG: hypothetical protein M0C28_45295 [Candidatus Moduliflexus flocculans]|nr:hypothetical protein [Candidatus Moduliflexus flocculans]
MKKGLFWTLAVVITLGSAVYQRMTGPTYPLKGKAALGGSEIRFELPRSAETTADAEVAVTAPAAVEGALDWRRFPTDDAWTRVPFVREGDRLVARMREAAGGRKGRLPGHPDGGRRIRVAHRRRAGRPALQRSRADLDPRPSRPGHLRGHALLDGGGPGRARPEAEPAAARPLDGRSDVPRRIRPRAAHAEIRLRRGLVGVPVRNGPDGQ